MGVRWSVTCGYIVGLYVVDDGLVRRRLRGVEGNVGACVWDLHDPSFACFLFGFSSDVNGSVFASFRRGRRFR